MLNTILIAVAAFILAATFPTIAKPVFIIWALVVVLYHFAK